VNTGAGRRTPDGPAPPAGGVQKVLALEPEIRSGPRARRQAARAVPRSGHHYPIALEAALKLKEISLHPCRGYPAGELKQARWRWWIKDMPVISIAPK